MVVRVRHAGVGAADARRVVDEAAREIGAARRAAGSSQARAGRRAGVSRQQFGRLERGELRRLTVDDLCRAARSVGLRCSVRFYPSELRVRDAGQLPVLARFERLLGAPLILRREVALPIEGDLRAWDARIVGLDHVASVDAETRLTDVQAIARRTALKQRDDPTAGVVLLVLSRTTHNRAVLREHREALRGQFPLDGAAIARALRRGEVPPAGGIILL